MNAKFALNQNIATPVANGTIKAIAPFHDHVEYLVEFEDKTATWLHEETLQPATSAAAEAANPNPPTPNP